MLTSVLLVAAGAASGPSQYVPARSGGWPGWLAGPFAGLGVGLSADGFQTLTLIMAASYLAVLLAARTLSGRDDLGDDRRRAPRAVARARR